MARLALAALAVLGAACGAADESPPQLLERARNLVVIVLDALPAKAVGAWGYERDTTPNLDGFAASGVRFASAYAGASYTLASVSSMFTALSPAAHGVVSLDSNVLGARHATLAESLSAAGFATAGFSSNPHVTAEGGFGQGFDVFGAYARERFDVHAIPSSLTDDALAFWEANRARRRFLYVHVLPPHQPYDPPEPHASRFGASERRLGLTDWLVAADQERSVSAGSAEALAIRARYDGGVHYADAFLGEFLERLSDSGAWEDTLWCVVSDHGEAFGEHGRLLHGTTVFAEMTHVPLVLAWPDAEPTVVPDVVSTIDLAPTLCELLGLGFAEGRSFAGAIFAAGSSGTAGGGTGRALSRSVGNHPVWALRTEQWTLLEQPSAKRRMLFDRELDPGETRDLLAGSGKRSEAARTAAELARVLRAALARDRRRSRRFEVESDTTHRAAIEDLGYVELESGQ